MALVFVSPPTQAVFIAASAIKVGVCLWKHLNRHKIQANTIIKQTENQVADVIKRVEEETLVGIDDLTDEAVGAVDVLDSTTPKRRKLRKRCKAPFRAYLVKVGKAKFGLLKRSEANYMCVRKFLFDECVQHGLVARHIVENLDFATEMVFVPMAYELSKLAIKHTETVNNNNIVASLLGRDESCH